MGWKPRQQGQCTQREKHPFSFSTLINDTNDAQLQASFSFHWHVGEGKSRKGAPLCHIEEFSLFAQVLEQESDIIRAVF